MCGGCRSVGRGAGSSDGGDLWSKVPVVSQKRLCRGVTNSCREGQGPPSSSRANLGWTTELYGFVELTVCLEGVRRCGCVGMWRCRSVGCRKTKSCTRLSVERVVKNAANFSVAALALLHCTRVLELTRTQRCLPASAHHDAQLIDESVFVLLSFGFECDIFVEGGPPGFPNIFLDFPEVRAQRKSRRDEATSDARG